jgi:hypothetical protein
MILRFNEEKWNEMISSGLTLGEILYENDEEFKSRLDVELNKNNRVTAAQFASIEAIAYTPRSPRFNFSIPQDSDLSTGSAKKVSESARKSTAHEAKLADELERWFESLTIKGK